MNSQCDYVGLNYQMIPTSQIVIINHHTYPLERVACNLRNSWSSAKTQYTSFEMSGHGLDRPGTGLPESSSHSAKSLGKAFARVDLDGHDLPPSPAPSSPRNGKRYALATELVYTEGTDQYNASSTPIYQVGSFSTCNGLLGGQLSILSQ